MITLRMRPTSKKVRERLENALGHVAPIAIPMSALAVFSIPISHQEKGVRLKRFINTV